MKDKSKLKGKHVQALVTDEMEQQIFDICFKLYAERAVIPSVCKTAVYFAAGIYKASALAEGNDFIHSFFSHCKKPPFTKYNNT